MNTVGSRTLFLRTPDHEVVVGLDRRSTVLATVVWLVTAVVAVTSLTLGQFELGATDVLRVLTGHGTPIEYDVVVRNRLPRVVTGLGTGVCFALSGAILQRIASNPLVSPDVIGVNSGAAVGALTALTVFGGAGIGTVLGALCGAVVTAAAIVLISIRRGLHGYRLVLVGIGVAAMLSSAISFLLTRADYHNVLVAAEWLTGSLANRGGVHVAVVVATLAVGVPVLVVLARQLRLLELGDDLARVLSGRATAAKLVLVLLAVCFAAMATAAAGPIGFVALVAPQIVRRLLPGRHVGLGLVAAVGAALVAGSDLAARQLFIPAELPVGVVTGVLGAPVLLYLLVRANRIGSAG